MDTLKEVLDQLADGNTILVTLKKESFSLRFKTRLKEKVKAIFSHVGSGEVYMTILSPFKSKGDVDIYIEDLLSVKLINSGIFYTRMKKGVYMTECGGYRITIIREKATKKWKYKTEKLSCCSWVPYKSESGIETLQKAKDLVQRIAHWWKYKEPEELLNKATAYCQG